MRDTKFAVTMALVILGMVIGMALLAAGCLSDREASEKQPVIFEKLHLDGSCFAVFKSRTDYDGVSLAAVVYPCPVVKEQLL